MKVIIEINPGDLLNTEMARAFDLLIGAAKWTSKSPDNIATKQPQPETESAQAVNETPAAEPESAKPEVPWITMEDLRAKASKISKLPGKSAAIKELLKKYGVVAVSKLEEKDFAHFDAALDSL